MVYPATSFDPLCIPLQQVQNQRSQVSSNQQGVVLFQQQLSQTLQNTLPVLLAPYLRREHMAVRPDCMLIVGVKPHRNKLVQTVFTVGLKKAAELFEWCKITKFAQWLLQAAHRTRSDPQSENKTHKTHYFISNKPEMSISYLFWQILA